jgi:hypothetical protein
MKVAAIIQRSVPGRLGESRTGHRSWYFGNAHGAPCGTPRWSNERSGAVGWTRQATGIDLRTVKPRGHLTAQ